MAGDSITAAASGLTQYWGADIAARRRGEVDVRHSGPGPGRREAGIGKGMAHPTWFGGPIIRRPGLQHGAPEVAARSKSRRATRTASEELGTGKKPASCPAREAKARQPLAALCIARVAALLRAAILTMFGCCQMSSTCNLKTGN